MAQLVLSLRAATKVSPGSGVLSEGTIGEEAKSNLMWLLAGLSSLRAVALQCQFLAGYCWVATLTSLSREPLQHAHLLIKAHTHEASRICQQDRLQFYEA